MIKREKIIPLIGLQLTLMLLTGLQLLIPSPIGKVAFFITLIAFIIILGRNLPKTVVLICLFSISLISIAIGLFNIIETDSKELTKARNSQQLIRLNNTSIYLNEQNKEALTIYNDFDEVYPLVQKENSEMSNKYFSFYKLNDDIQYAFPTHLASIGTEYLLDVRNEYMIKTYITPENHMDLIFTAGFRELLKLNTTTDSQILVYINPETKEILLYNGQIVLNHQYLEIAYNINDYFSVRYSRFQKEDKYKFLAENINVEMMKTIGEISDDVKRITFYNEIGDNNTIKTIVEIVVNDISYIFRTNPINANLIKNAIRS